MSPYLQLLGDGGVGGPVPDGGGDIEGLPGAAVTINISLTHRHLHQVAVATFCHHLPLQLKVVEVDATVHLHDQTHTTLNT